MDEAWISVDIEASGPTPSTGSMIAIGACLVEQPSVQFEATIAPIPGLPWSDEAERVHRLSRERLAVDGTTPENAMHSLVDWVEAVAAGRKPVFVGFNAPFDWMFVADYLWRFAAATRSGSGDGREVAVPRPVLGRGPAVVGDEQRRHREAVRDHDRAYPRATG